MKVKLGAIVTDVSGKIGGHIVGKNRGNHVFKNKSVSKKTPTSLQIIQRSQTAFIMSSWSKLTDDVRRSYYEAVRYYPKKNNFGVVVFENGFTLFLKLMQGLLVQGSNINSSNAILNKPSLANNLIITASTTSLMVQSVNMDQNTNVVIWVVPNVKNGVKNPKKKKIKLGVYSGVQLNAGLDFFNTYNEKVGVLVEGNSLIFYSKTYSKLSGYSNNVAVIQRVGVFVSSSSVPVLRITGNLSNYVPEEGGLVWQGINNDDGFTVDSGNRAATAFNTILELPNYISDLDKTIIFDTEVWGSSVINAVLLNGNYLIRFYFGNTFAGTSTVGSRVFDVLINNNIIFEKLDPILLFGQRVLGYVESAFVVSDGSAIISFNPIIEQPLWSAIEIIKTN